tara:strand:- start:810 stop:1022 length:213 start_codon:yes stop_codon:yes gene_type:complete
MQTKEKLSEKNSEDKQYYIVSDDLINWMRGVAYTKLTLEEVNGFSEELFNAPTFQQYLDMQQKKPKIITK